jgi:hypothetical protein
LTSAGLIDFSGSVWGGSQSSSKTSRVELLVTHVGICGTDLHAFEGSQKRVIVFSHPEFQKREATLMSSRDATRENFEQVISYIREKKLIPCFSLHNGLILMM